MYGDWGRIFSLIRLRRKSVELSPKDFWCIDLESGDIFEQVKLCRFARLELLCCELNDKGLCRICESEWLLGVRLRRGTRMCHSKEVRMI